VRIISKFSISSACIDMHLVTFAMPDLLIFIHLSWHSCRPNAWGWEERCAVSYNGREQKQTQGSNPTRLSSSLRPSHLQNARELLVKSQNGRSREARHPLQRCGLLAEATESQPPWLQLLHHSFLHVNINPSHLVQHSCDHVISLLCERAFWAVRSWWIPSVATDGEKK